MSLDVSENDVVLLPSVDELDNYDSDDDGSLSGLDEFGYLLDRFCRLVSFFGFFLPQWWLLS